MTNRTRPWLLTSLVVGLACSDNSSSGATTGSMTSSSANGTKTQSSTGGGSGGNTTGTVATTSSTTTSSVGSGSPSTSSTGTNETTETSDTATTSSTGETGSSSSGLYASEVVCAAQATKESCEAIPSRYPDDAACMWVETAVVDETCSAQGRSARCLFGSLWGGCPSVSCYPPDSGTSSDRPIGTPFVRVAGMSLYELAYFPVGHSCGDVAFPASEAWEECISMDIPEAVCGCACDVF